MKLMVVDDDLRIRQVLAHMLAEGGYGPIEQASDGEEALAKLACMKVDLILTDCCMARMDGLGLTRALRGRGDMTPIIMLSGEVDPGLVVRAVKAGVNNYIPKPVHPQMLLEKIGATLGGVKAVK